MGARMGTEGSNAKAGVNPSGEEDGVDVLLLGCGNSLFRALVAGFLKTD